MARTSGLAWCVHSQIEYLLHGYFLKHFKAYRRLASPRRRTCSHALVALYSILCYRILDLLLIHAFLYSVHVYLLLGFAAEPQECQAVQSAVVRVAGPLHQKDGVDPGRRRKATPLGQALSLAMAHFGPDCGPHRCSMHGALRAFARCSSISPRGRGRGR